MFGFPWRLGSLETKSFRKKFGDVRLLRPVRALKKYCRVGSELEDHLPAGSAGRAGNAVIIGDGYGSNFNLRPEFCHGGKDRGPLRAITHAIGSIFDVTAGEHFSIREQDRRTDVKVRVGRV